MVSLIKIKLKKAHPRLLLPAKPDQKRIWLSSQLISEKRHELTASFQAVGPPGNPNISPRQCVPGLCLLTMRQAAFPNYCGPIKSWAN